MPEVEVSRFTGIDLVGSRVRKGFGPLLDAKNIAVTAAGTLQTRPGTRKVAELHEQSVGLFAASGILHTLVPAGSKGYKGFEPYNVSYDPVGNSATADFADRTFDADGNLLTGMKRLHNAVTFGLEEDDTQRPYVVIEMANGDIRHHWLESGIDDYDDQLNNYVSLPFVAAPGLVKMRAKLFAIDRGRNDVRYSATLRPLDWSTDGDAGSLEAANHVSSDTEAIGITEHTGALIVMHRNAVQVWDIGITTTAYQHIQSVEGPGAIAIGSLQKIESDVIFLADGGFNTLRSFQDNQERRPENVGALIAPLSNVQDLEDIVSSVWNQRRQEYMCAFNRNDGGRILVLKRVSSLNVMAWTYWDVPFRIDYMCVLNGDVYIRSGDTVHVFDDEVEIDEETGSKVAFEWQTTQFVGSRGRYNKEWLSFDVVSNGRARYDFVFDVNDSYEEGPYLEDSTLWAGMIPIADTSPSLGIHCVGSGEWEMDSLFIRWNEMRGGGAL